jgi:hypothetical protein
VVSTPLLLKANTAIAAGFADLPGVFSAQSATSSLYGSSSSMSMAMPPIQAPLAPSETSDEKAAVRARLKRGAEEKVFRDLVFAYV